MMDGSPISISNTSALFVPKGVKHEPHTWKRIRPRIEMTVMLGADTPAEADPGGRRQ